MPKPVLPLPALTPAVAKVLDESYQHAFAKLVGQRLAAARQQLVAEHGDLYSQERVGRLLKQSQTWLSNLENAHRRVDTSALLLLSTLYGVTTDSLIGPPRGDEEVAAMRRWMRAYRALQVEDAVRERERSRPIRGPSQQPSSDDAPSVRPARPRR